MPHFPDFGAAAACGADAVAFMPSSVKPRLRSSSGAMRLLRAKAMSQRSVFSKIGGLKIAWCQRHGRSGGGSAGAKMATSRAGVHGNRGTAASFPVIMASALRPAVRNPKPSLRRPTSLAVRWRTCRPTSGAVLSCGRGESASCTMAAIEPRRRHQRSRLV